MKYKKLKLGQAFQFCKDGAVFVRCRGGFRHGLGGTLYAATGEEQVFIFSLD